MKQIPHYWKHSLTDISGELQKVRLGRVSAFAESAGKRDIYLVEYGEKEDFKRQANYGSACGARNVKYYARKEEDNKPVVMFIAGIHGGEFEGIVGTLNLLRVIETGEDMRGRRWDYIHERWSQYRLLIIPCMNPDGRARVPLDTIAGCTLAELRYYIQGTWKDGSLCGYPGCKAVHPILDQVDHLGGYFNDQGINMMHDNFFMPMAPETASLMALTDIEAPDFIVGLHGGGNCTNFILKTDYIPARMGRKIDEFDDRLYESSLRHGLRFKKQTSFFDDNVSPPPSFGLSAALHHISGGISFTYESNQALNDTGDTYSYDEILESHLLLFEESLKYLSQPNNYPVY